MQNKRIHVVDALRGFALAGIVLVHMVENYIGGVPPEGVGEVMNQGVFDNIIQGFMFIFIRGKFFALFSFLFGLSFFIQMDKAAQKGTNLGRRFLWRLILLFCIGFVHHLFYRGDILTTYAILGILLIPFYKLNTKWLLAFSILLFIGTGRYIVFATSGNDLLFSDISIDPQSEDVVNYFNTIKNGTLAQVFSSNATEGHLVGLDFQLGFFGRGYLTFGFFLLGLLMGKIGFFQHYTHYLKKPRKGLIWAIVSFVLTSLLMAVLFMAAAGGKPVAMPSFDNWLYMFALTAYDLSNISMTCILILSFLLIYTKPKGQRILLKLAPYGKMALTSYIMQTLIGTFILYGWGLGYVGGLRHSYTFLIGVAILFIQLQFSKWWLTHYVYGPLEWLWRSLTYFKVFPFTHKKVQA